MGKKNKFEKTGKKDKTLRASIKDKFGDMSIDPTCLKCQDVIHVSKHPDKFRHGFMHPECEAESTKVLLAEEQIPSLADLEQSAFVHINQQEYLRYVEKVLHLA